MPGPILGAGETVVSWTNCPLKKDELFAWNLPFVPTPFPSTENVSATQGLKAESWGWGSFLTCLLHLPPHLPALARLTTDSTSKCSVWSACFSSSYGHLRPGLAHRIIIPALCAAALAPSNPSSTQRLERSFWEYVACHQPPLHVEQNPNPLTRFTIPTMSHGSPLSTSPSECQHTGLLSVS